MKQEALLKQANIYDTVGIWETAALFPNGHAVRTAFMNQMTASELCVLPLSALSPAPSWGEDFLSLLCRMLKYPGCGLPSCCWSLISKWAWQQDALIAPTKSIIFD